MIRALRRLIGVALAVYVLTLLTVSAFALLHRNPASPPNVEMIVCLGAGATKAGAIGAGSAARAEACAEAYLLGAAPVILFTGANSDPTKPSIARVMADHAMARGVPDTAVIVEERSRSTLQNALFSAPLIGEAQTILLVTHGFHLPRSYASFAAIGQWQIEPWSAGGIAYDADGSVNWSALPREALAIWFNFARYLIWKAAKMAGATDVDYLLT